MTDDPTALYHRDGRIGRVTLNRPDVLNAINDRRAWWLTPSAEVKAQAATFSNMPEAGAINSGTVYRHAALSVRSSSRLHTLMFVQPDGLDPASYLPIVEEAEMGLVLEAGKAKEQGDTPAAIKYHQKALRLYPGIEDWYSAIVR